MRHHLTWIVLTAACSNSASNTPIDAPVVGDAPVADAAPAPDPVADAAAPTIGPTANSVAAATATATSNAQCTAVAPFYWEIGDQTAALASGSVGVDSGGDPVLATTKLSIASASKWIYGAYVVQLRGSAAALTANDITFLHFTSGYTNIGGDSTTATCPQTLSPDDVNACLALTNANNGKPYSYQDPATIGKFFYDGGHLENHASLYGGLGDVHVTALGTTVGALLGAGTTIVYSQPLMAGGIVADANTYTAVLRHILDGSLAMHDALGANPVCTLHSDTCNAVTSPIPEAWHYSMAHWVEDDPAVHGDGAFSSAGAFGFYPWIDAAKKYYGVVSREAAPVAGVQAGYLSAQCGRLIRHAWDTGVEQTGSLPQ